MNFAIAFLNCGRQQPDWASLASTLHTAVGNDPHIVGLCEVYDNGTMPQIVAALNKKTGKKYLAVMSKVSPPAPRLGILIDASLGHLHRVGDDEAFRHGGDWRHWLAARVDFFKPNTKTPSLKQLVVVANHWPSMMRGKQETIAHREIIAWEVGSWMCSKDKNARQIVFDGLGHAIPVCRQPSIVMGDFNCEPGSQELRSRRKFTLQAMRNEPQQWKVLKLRQDTHALLYDLSWRRLMAGPTPAVSGTYDWDDLHSPAMLDRMLVSQALWNGPDMKVTLNRDRQAMRIVPAEMKCSDHSAIAITVELR
jgi:endonuclease/exonuclease/phosphatase family metal-dependent hydrolase